ncbi:hypothetical protein NDU88_003938 [Pleurodeles waltl]|uniref:Secreted protein n=1 Tax=Pleurodeles waltl TaxID=8319 RepID=A0AAV7M642_PLEWA|nr:hypothetical protein NDU88_003938 [Pleurodeles waltl]
MRLANGFHRFLRVGNGLFASHFRFCTVANCESARLRVAIVCYIWPLVPTTGNAPNHNMDTSHFPKENRAVFC